MIKRTTLAIVIVSILLLIAGWESSVIPHHIQGECAYNHQAGKQECPSYYTAFYVVWQFAKFIDEHNGTFSAFFAAVVALFTWRLYISTRNLFEATNRSADAALLNAQALIDAERAHLYAVIKKHNLREALRAANWYGDTHGEGGSSPLPHIELSLKNLGRTPAIMHEVSAQIVQGTPNQHEFKYAMAEVVDPVIDGEQGTATTMLIGLRSHFTTDDARSALQGDRPLYFYGWVTFSTSFDRVYKYCWRYRNVGTDWVLTHYEENERGKPNATRQSQECSSCRATPPKDMRPCRLASPHPFSPLVW
jgi:hypothetical protein